MSQQRPQTLSNVAIGYVVMLCGSGWNNPLNAMAADPLVSGQGQNNVDNDIGDVNDESAVGGVYNPQMSGKAGVHKTPRQFPGCLKPWSS